KLFQLEISRIRVRGQIGGKGGSPLGIEVDGEKRNGARRRFLHCQPDHRRPALDPALDKTHLPYGQGKWVGEVSKHHLNVHFRTTRIRLPASETVPNADARKPLLFAKGIKPVKPPP